LTSDYIDKPYDLLTTANVNRYELRGRVDTLENVVFTLQAEVARLAALIEKFISKSKQKASGKPQKNRS